MAPITLLLSLSVAAAQSTRPFVPVESPTAYEITVSVAIAALPEDLRPFLEGCRAAITEAATKCLAAPNDESAHGFPLDGAAKSSAPADRRAQVSALLHPSNEDQAQAQPFCASMSKTSLPGRLATSRQALAESFRSMHRDNIARDVGTILHYSVDAALPFNATHDKWSEGPPASNVHPPQAPTSRRYRYHVTLVERLAGRLAFEARVSPNRVQPLTDADRAVLETLAAAHEAALALERIELEVAARAAPGENTSRIEQDLAASAAPILESQIEAGALLAARFILTAWMEAGRPTLRVDSAAAGTLATKPPAKLPSTDAAIGAFVGSRSSKTYHRATCRHVERIKLENRVVFETPQQAEAKGRQPCKTCKPDQP